MMTLSESIRLGAMMRPQAFGRSRSGKARCALMSAFSAIGNESLYADTSRWPQEFTWALQEIGLCSQCNTKAAIYYLITHLNDHHQWTRERIASWVATLEAQGVEGGQVVRCDADDPIIEKPLPLPTPQPLPVEVEA